MVVWLYEWLTGMPYLAFAVGWLTVYLLYGKVQTATFAAMDVSALLFAGAVAKLLTDWTGSPWGAMAVLFILLLYGGLLARRQETKQGRVELLQVLRWLCRTGFVVLVPLYAVLLVLTS